ncbi:MULTISPECIES: cupin domain-containing protein [Streptomyces]|uniref:cupin domain-containing protein n=1 Tax=Streptomyces TaxID=1883 RepID=UPI002119DF76|nr:cupin domain-containing protein [Streptomyces hilarionis]MCQ9134961.1 cupin domain-containing protein [Streptomyces hilarionis]
MERTDQRNMTPARLRRTGGPTGPGAPATPFPSDRRVTRRPPSEAGPDAGSAHRAQAGPRDGPAPVLLADGLLTERLGLDVPQDTRVVVTDYEIPPGGSLPWHYHEGRVVAVVTAGVLTRTLADGSECVTPAGGCIVEPVGPRGVHMAENRAADPLRICALFFLPRGAALSTRADPPDAAAGP